MARPYSIEEAKQIIEEHSIILNNLQKVSKATEGYRESVRRCCKSMTNKETLDLLRDISLDELNREKNGFRIKSLREHGFNNIADIYAASVYSIASVQGITQETANAIKVKTDNIARDARTTVKIKLSTDNRTQAAGSLVLALYKFHLSQEISKAGRILYQEKEAKIHEHIKTLSNSQVGGIKWFFTPKIEKDSATYSFNWLKELLSSDYKAVANQYYSDFVSIERRYSDEAWNVFSKNSVVFFNDLEQICPGVLGNDDIHYGLSEDLAREIQEECFFPDGLLCTLRRYQEWGVKYALHQEKVLLGDEMGLGKTVQAIATMVSLRNTGGTHFVVVCPASVLPNWCREIRKMSRLSVTKIHGSDREKALASWLKTGGVAVTTYETTSAFSLPGDFRFSMMVVDEAHYIKNPEAIRTRNVKALCQKAERLLFMTGTALENKVEEMISLIGILQPDIASRLDRMAFMPAAPLFRRTVAPVYYRRKREDVLTELPDLIESQEWCSMTKNEEAKYEEVVLERSYAQARRVSWNVDNINDSSKAARLLELISEAKAEGRKVIVFSFFLDTIDIVMSLLGKNCYGPINGSVPPQRRQEIIDSFDNAPAGSALAAQIQSGGTGLNIQSASVVIICEPQFKPSIENQAISRAYRMGQTRNVLVYRLLCEDTIDERIMSLLEDKQAIFDAFADKSVAAKESLEMDEKTLGNIIEEEIVRINARRKKQCS